MANRTGTSLQLSSEIGNAYQEVRQKNSSDDWYAYVTSLLVLFTRQNLVDVNSIPNVLELWLRFFFY